LEPIDSADAPLGHNAWQNIHESWFLNFHCFTNYVKVAFFCGASLRPVPPGESKQKDVRYLDIYEEDASPKRYLRRGSGRRPRCPAGDLA
jgi:hypothetical protein